MTLVQGSFRDYLKLFNDKSKQALVKIVFQSHVSSLVIHHAFNLIRHVNTLQDHTLIAMKGRNLLLDFGREHFIVFQELCNNTLLTNITAECKNVVKREK